MKRRPLALLAAALACFLAGACIVWALNRPPGPASGAPDSPAATRGAAEQASASPTEETPTPSTPPLTGEELATTWLRGYLTRPAREDQGWEEEVEDITTSDLMDFLTDTGPDFVGLTALESWQVEKVTGWDNPAEPISTPTRQVSSWQVTITDGHTSVPKSFVIIAYPSRDGVWRVGTVTVPYASEG